MNDDEYPIVETFYSLKGEGMWTGQPMFFIRLAGCNLACDFCDTPWQRIDRHMSRDELVDEAIGANFTRASRCSSKRVVITGGEPLIHNLTPLLTALKSIGYYLHLETNGTRPLQPGFDWVCVSPKSPVNELNPSTMQAADEIKFLAGYNEQMWQEYIDNVIHAHGLMNDRQQLIVMPLANPYPSKDVNPIWVEAAIDYVKANPWFRYNIQLHKALGIR